MHTSLPTYPRTADITPVAPFYMSALRCFGLLSTVEQLQHQCRFLSRLFYLVQWLFLMMVYQWIVFFHILTVSREHFSDVEEVDLYFVLNPNLFRDDQGQWLNPDRSPSKLQTIA